MSQNEQREYTIRFVAFVFMVFLTIAAIAVSSIFVYRSEYAALQACYEAGLADCPRK